MIRFVSINNVIGGLEVGLVRRGMNQRLFQKSRERIERSQNQVGVERKAGSERETELLVVMTRGRRWLSDLVAWL